MSVQIPGQTRREASRLLGILSLAAPLAAAGYALAFSWGHWGDVVIDWGRELELARRLGAGDRLYTDVHYWYGPIAPHVNAWLFSLFGVHTRTLQFAGLGTALLMTILLGALAARLAGIFAAATVTTAFVSLCAFGHYYMSDIFNWVTPYAYPATYGMLLATATLYALLRATDAAGFGWFAVSLACWILTLITKLEPAFAATMAHAAFLLTAARAGDRRRGRLLVSYAAAVTVTALVVAALAFRTGGDPDAANMLSQLNQRTRGPILRYMGLSDWREALAAVGTSSLRLAACLAAPVLVARVLRPTGSRAIALAALGCALVAVISFADGHPETVLRALPIVALVATVDAIAAFLRTPTPALRARVVLWGFALGALARLPLAAGAHHYGFYLLPVPLAAVLLLWFGRLPELAGGGHAAALLCRSTVAALVATLGWSHLRASQAFYALHTAHVVTSRGDVWLIDGIAGVPIGQIYSAVVKRLGEYPPDTTVLAAPEGAGLVFLAGLPTWGRDFSYYPPEVGPAADVRLRRAVEASPPGLLLLTNVIDLRPYGVIGFGRDYATESVGWLLQHYQVDRSLPGNTVVIARPRGSTPPTP